MSITKLLYAQNSQEPKCQTSAVYKGSTEKISTVIFTLSSFIFSLNLYMVSEIWYLGSLKNLNIVSLGELLFKLIT